MTPSRRQFCTAMLLAPAAVTITSSARSGVGSVSVRKFGATGDGKNDDTEAFRRATLSGSDLFIPATANFYRLSRTIALARAGQRIYGEGERSRIVQTGQGSNSDVFVAQFDDCHFANLHLTPGTETTVLANGWGIAVLDARGVTISSCYFSGMRRGGVMLSNAVECLIAGNSFTESVVRGDGSEPQSQTGFDIYLTGSASRNRVRGNNCMSGVGVGIGCQTSPGRSQEGNVIADNRIANQPAYGIMIYRGGVGDTIYRVVIERNVVRNISGAIYTDGKTRFYGCGIYVASANHFSVIDNRVTNTNTDRNLPFSGSGVPAGIGISGYGDGLVRGNEIEGCYDGIASIQTLEPEVGDKTIIENNIVRRCDHTGVLLLDSVGAAVRGNHLIGTPGSSQGIYAAHVAASHRGNLSITENAVEGFGVGIEVRERLPFADISGNRVSGNLGHAIYAAPEELRITGNTVSGIAISAQAGRGIVRDNVIGERGIQDGTRGRISSSRNRRSP
jgi:hypothetical protein